MHYLLQKDFKLFYGNNKSIKAKVASAFVKALFLMLFIAILIFMLTGIVSKIDTYDNASPAFLSLFLEIISVIVMLSFTIRSNKLFFNKNDLELTSKFPIKNRDIIISKLVFLFVTYYATMLIFTYPLFVSYGIITKAKAWFYVLTFFYPLGTFFFDMGIALILFIPYSFLKRKLKNYFLARFMIYLVILFVCAFLYYRILNVFVNLVAGGDITYIFTKSVVNKFINLRKIELPASPFIGLVLEKKVANILFFLIEIFVFGVGLLFSVLYYRKFKNDLSKPKTNNIMTKYKNKSATRTIIGKELSILTKNDNYIISFMCLLIIQPLLAYLIIYAMNLIFRTGIFQYYISIVPNFISILDVLILVLFTIIINQGANNYIGMESRTLTIMKTIPVSVKKQLYLKVSIPFILSFASFIITDIFLISTKLIKFDVFASAIVLVGIILFIYEAICLFEELRMRFSFKRSYFVSNAFSYLLPVVFFISATILSCLNVNLILIYAISSIIIALLGLYFVYSMFDNVEDKFLEIERIDKNYK